MSSTFLNQLLLIYNKQKINEIIFITALLAVRSEYNEIQSNLQEETLEDNFDFEQQFE